MNAALLLPGALAAMIALAIPLIIHIARRSEQQPTDFAALRWLRQRPRPRSRLRFEEWLLLALRLALLALLALWLAHPVWFGAIGDRLYVAVVPGVDLPRGGVAAVAKGDAHWLAPGFPGIDDEKARPPVSQGSISSLLRQLDAELPPGAGLTVLVPRLIEGADAERPRLSRKVDWRIVPGSMASKRPSQLAVPALSVRADAAHGPAIRYFRAAAIAWQSAGTPADFDSATIGAPLPDSSHTLVWLAGGTLPRDMLTWIERGGSALAASDAALPDGVIAATLWADDLGRPLVQAMPIGKGRLLRLTRPLVPADMPELVDADFPGRLRALLAAPTPAPARVAAADHAPLTGAKAYDQPPFDLRPWLAVLIAALLLIERWFATRRRRGVSP